ncbi:hypothetical protein CCACVL1_19557 [Corchorus capsularis]|uniref:Uncharacterized protein n=1 Tax=Corchorus capsularis TaxID=210143 RepID=A0A1R3HG94_COCAP|nr:hypothetical protein CCACVL1_19557 [Corchorus capsularis]
MAREFVVLGGNGPGEEVAGFVTRGGSGGLLLLCMIVFSISIISMIVFACGDDGNSGRWHIGFIRTQALIYSLRKDSEIDL